MDKSEQTRRFMEKARQAGFVEKKEPFTYASFGKQDPKHKPKEKEEQVEEE